MHNAAIEITGSYLPAHCVPNEALNQFSPSAKKLIGQKTGREVFKFAVRKGSEMIEALLAKTGVGIQDVRCIICHQANVI